MTNQRRPATAASTDQPQNNLEVHPTTSETSSRATLCSERAERFVQDQEDPRRRRRRRTQRRRRRRRRMAGPYSKTLQESDATRPAPCASQQRQERVERDRGRLARSRCISLHISAWIPSFRLDTHAKTTSYISCIIVVLELYRRPSSPRSDPPLLPSRNVIAISPWNAICFTGAPSM